MVRIGILVIINNHPGGRVGRDIVVTFRHDTGFINFRKKLFYNFLDTITPAKCPY
jgi:hypothetical protein